ncbi:hypothetical protein K466DRAFT_604389 [Polyporus arcularius HHB13444]|uniref:F-box domain-containing protein n=1 Tax=Polyporus arcularius HHB13444 TaxID=1314778 RepID=A0A5C3NVT4_9APHY|nr:hypothetical protein K466DRAFT_604389 [Polyporus arcularius HHB13444]
MPPVLRRQEKRTARDVPVTSHPSSSLTLNRFGLYLPPEVYSRIAEILAVPELKALVRTCKQLHDLGSRVLYHTVEATHEDGHRIFAALLLRYQRTSMTHIRDAPLLSVRCISYVSTCADDDLRVFPLLGDVLVRALDLRHLHIDIFDRSSSPLLAVLKRRGLVRCPPSPIAAAFDCTMNRPKRMSCPYNLPRLTGLQLSSCKILGELGKMRTLKSVILDETVSRNDMVAMMDALNEDGRGRHVLSFSCIFGTACGEGFLWAIAAAFPNLTFLALTVPDEVIPHFYDETYHAVSTILTFLISAPFVLTNLQVLALEFYWTVSAAWDVFVEHVQWERLTILLTALIRARPSLRQFFLARAELRFDVENGKWHVNDTDLNDREGRKRTLATAGSCRKFTRT